MPSAVALYTREAVSDVLSAGGSGNWATRLDRAQKYPYLVLVRNRRHPSSPSDADHGTAFLVGRVAGAREVADIATNGKPRVFIEISEWAKVTVRNAWKTNSSNPVWYTDFETLGIEEDQLKFQPLPRPLVSNERGLQDMPPSLVQPRSLTEVKREIARLYGVPENAVEIIIRH
jgi:hypothetical protein